MPEFEFASFNADAGTYQVQKSQPSPLLVEGALDKSLPDATQKILPKKSTAPEREQSPQSTEIPPPSVIEENKSLPTASKLWSNQAVFWCVQTCLVAMVLALAAHRWNARRLAALGPGPLLRREAAKIHAELPNLRSKTDWFQQARRAVQLLTASRSGQTPEAVDLPETLYTLAPASNIEADLRWLFETDATLRFSGTKVDTAPKTEEQERIQSLLRNLFGEASS
jgi:hypothetical protein